MTIRLAFVYPFQMQSVINKKVPDIAARHPLLIRSNYPQQGNPQHMPMAQQAAMTLPGAAANAVPADIETAIAASFAIRTIVRLLI
jgi:hypothetical protein